MDAAESDPNDPIRERLRAAHQAAFDALQSRHGVSPAEFLVLNSLWISAGDSTLLARNSSTPSVTTEDCERAAAACVGKGLALVQ